MAKPLNQANHVYWISQTYLMKYMGDTSYPDLHTVRMYQLERYVMLDSQLCSNHRKSKLNATTK